MHLVFASSEVTRDGGAGGAGGALAPPLLRRMTFYFVLVYVVIRENTYILLDGLVCSIVGYFYESRRILASP